MRLSPRLAEYVANHLPSPLDLYRCQRGMDQEHQTCFTQFSCDRKWRSGGEVVVGETPFLVHIRTGAFVTGNTLFTDGCDDAVAIPVRLERLQLDEGVEFVPGMFYVRGDNCWSDAVKLRQRLWQLGGVVLELGCHSSIFRGCSLPIADCISVMR